VNDTWRITLTVLAFLCSTWLWYVLGKVQGTIDEVRRRISDLDKAITKIKHLAKTGHEAKNPHYLYLITEVIEDLNDQEGGAK